MAEEDNGDSSREVIGSKSDSECEGIAEKLDAISLEEKIEDKGATLHELKLGENSNPLEGTNGGHYKPTLFEEDGGATLHELKPGESSNLVEGANGGQHKPTPSEEGTSSPYFEVKFLSVTTVDDVVEYILKGNAKNVITMVGAGISTSAGIPDFRTQGSGLYYNLQKYDLPYPQAIFEASYFKSNPLPFFTLTKELMPGSYNPTKTHYLIRLLADKNILLRHYTQNIDGLERQVGVPDKLLVEAHGTFHYSHCLSCYKVYDLDWLKAQLKTDDVIVPRCEECNCVVKPDIVLFGESLPHKFYESVEEDFDKCDLLIIMGSSLCVEPFASLSRRVKKNCPRLLVNKEEVGRNHGLKYGKKNNYRDVVWKGSCDDFTDIFVCKLNWNSDLQNLMRKEETEAVTECD